MKVFIYFEGFCETFDIPPDQTVGAMKQMVKERFLVQLSDDKQVWNYLELSYGGAALQDSWALSDVGITSGSTLRCLIKSEPRPVMHVFNAVTGESLPVPGSEALLHMSVARLKTMVSMQSGLPVSAFRLSVFTDVQLYDCNQLQDYAIGVGATLRLDTWDGWVEFLQGCVLGHRLTVQSHLSDDRIVMRFQLRVALYIAASLGHLDLAGWLLERGVHAEEPVGVHPYRQWCHQTAHRDTGKCPIHVAVESSQLLILKLFITKNLLTLACRDPAGCDPLKIAIKNGHRDCVRYLANKLCSVVSLPNMPMPVRIYLQMKHWVSLGQKRAASNRCQYVSASFEARVGDMLLVDGFNQPQMSSKSRKAETKQRRGIRAKALQRLPPISNLLSVSHLHSKRAPPHLPSLQSVKPGDFKETQKKRKQDVKHRNDGPLYKTKEGDIILCRGKFTLPPVTRENIPKPLFVGSSQKSSNILTASLESFSQHCGRTPRENAIYCLSIASTFTEKPWMKQLSIARTLIRKHVHSMA
ncbi:protein ANKUB1-like [Seriola aureovittata]|uniref:protein ANKUB1-like n=1 Tax=Seriola aureovittata TaxID=2871759 RepID=UPI0024BDE2FA|nr:protein ANKUB1-like [Seriola aureovittata]